MNHSVLIFCLFFLSTASQDAETVKPIAKPLTEYNYRRATKKRTHEYFNKSLYKYMNKFEITDLERELLEEDKRLKEELDIAMVKAGRSKIKTKKKKVTKQAKIHFDEKRILSKEPVNKTNKQTKTKQSKSTSKTKRLKNKNDINV